MNPPMTGAIIQAKMRKPFPRGPAGMGPPKISIRRKPVAKKTMTPLKKAPKKIKDI